MSKDPQEDKSYDCKHCKGDGKDPADRAEKEQYIQDNPEEGIVLLESDIDDCPECDGLGEIDPDDQEEDFDFKRDQERDREMA